MLDKTQTIDKPIGDSWCIWAAPYCNLRARFATRPLLYQKSYHMCKK